jgi:hypothetical protein
LKKQISLYEKVRNKNELNIKEFGFPLKLDKFNGLKKCTGPAQAIGSPCPIFGPHKKLDFFFKVH